MQPRNRMFISCFHCTASRKGASSRRSTAGASFKLFSAHTNKPFHPRTELRDSHCISSRKPARVRRSTAARFSKRCCKLTRRQFRARQKLGGCLSTACSKEVRTRQSTTSRCCNNCCARTPTLRAPQMKRGGFRCLGWQSWPRLTKRRLTRGRCLQRSSTYVRPRSAP